MSERPSRWAPVAARDNGSPGELANARCALCGIELSIISLVPDGGPGSADVRWYCRDIVSCTERWTNDWARRAGQAPVSDGNAPDPDGEPVPDKQVRTPGDTASVFGDARVMAGEPGPASEPQPADGSGPSGEPEATEEPEPEPEPEPDKVRAGQSAGGGHRDMD